MFHRSLCSLLQSLTRLSLSVSLEPAKAGAKRQKTDLANRRPLWATCGNRNLQEIWSEGRMATFFIMLIYIKGDYRQAYEFYTR